jgi:PAS domain S-box-containing protein
MPSDALAGPAPASGRGEDAVRCVEVAPRFRLVSEDDQRERKRSRTGLLESERLFRTMFERAVVGIAHVRPDGRWLRVNQRLCDILGYRCDELTMRHWQDFTHPDDRAACLAYVQRALAGEVDGYETDKRYVRKDGALIWAHLTVSLVRTPRGAPDYFIAMVQDITERKRLERERLRLLEQERAAHVEAEATNAQLQAMQALTDTALSHLALDDLLRELLDRVLAVMGVDNVAIFLLDADERTLTMRAVRGLLEEDVGRVRIPVGHGFGGRIAASKAPLIVDDLPTREVDAACPWRRETSCSVAGVPLLVDDQGEDRLVGVIGVGSVAPRHFTESDVHLLQRAADRIALAIGRARLYAAEQDARQQAEAALARATTSETQAAERAERLNTILETMADGVAVYDTEGRPIQQVNRAYRELFALERAPAEYEALPTFDRARLLHVGDTATGAPLPFERTPVGRALRGETVTGPSADIRVRAFDGRELEVNSSAAPRRDGDGRVAGVVLVLRDMTEHNRLAREREAARADELVAREASRRMEEFLATAAHDLRTPLTATLGYLALAERQVRRLASAARKESPDLAQRVEDARDRLEDAGKAGKRLTRLLTLLFDTAAIRADRLELHRAPCDLSTLVREQVEALRVAAPGRVIRLHVPAAGAPVPVEADADRIAQVITNYLTNAIKYSPPDRRVNVSVAVHGDRARVAVCDAGPGLPKEERVHVWELFHRAPGVAAQGGAQGEVAGGSLGLGLYICKAIIRAHGGRVGVKSVVGRGSTFWFTLPLAHEPSP